MSLKLPSVVSVWIVEINRKCDEQLKEVEYY